MILIRDLVVDGIIQRQSGTLMQTITFDRFKWKPWLAIQMSQVYLAVLYGGKDKI